MGRRSERGGRGGASLMSHTSYLQAAAGRRVREAAGQGAAPLPPARFGCPGWGRAHGTRRGTARLGHAGAVALPGGPRLCRAAHILDMMLQLWIRSLRDQIHYWPLAALMVQNSHKSPPPPKKNRLLSAGLLCIRWSRAGDPSWTFPVSS